MMNYSDYNIKTFSFADALPVLDILEERILLLKNGDLAAIIELDLPEIYTISEYDYAMVASKWQNAIGALPGNTVLHKQDIFTKVPIIARSDSDSFLSKASNAHFQGRTELKHKTYLYITKTTRETRNKYFFKYKHGDFEEPKLKKRLYEFKETIKSFLGILGSDEYISLTQLTEKDILDRKGQGIYQNFLNLSFSDQPVYQKLVSHGSKLWIGNKECHVFNVSSLLQLPEILKSSTREHGLNLSTSFLSRLGSLLNCNHIVNQYIFIEEPDITIKNLETRIKRYKSLLPYSAYNQYGLRDTQEYLNRLQEFGGKPIKMHMNVMLFTETQDEFLEQNSELNKAMVELGLTMVQESSYNSMLYWCALPANGSSLPDEETFYIPAPSASCLLINDTNYKSSNEPFALKVIDRIEAKPVFADFTEEPYRKQIITNRNKFILGPAGSGKSFFTNHLVRSYYEGGAHTLIVDIGGSYKTQYELIKESNNGTDGVYFTYDENNPISFNPFMTLQMYDDIERRQSIFGLIVSIWKNPNEELTKFDTVTLKKLIRDYSFFVKADRSIKPSFNHFFEYIDTVFRKKMEAISTGKTDFDIDKFLYIIEPFYKGGEYDFLLNSEEELDLLKQRLIIFELRNINEEPVLLPVVLIMIMDAYANKLFRLPGDVKRVLIIEEAWKAISRPNMADYIQSMFRTVRKHTGEAIIVTQDLDDIISSEIIKKVIINNSDCKILLDQSKYQNRFDEVQKFLGLTDIQKEQILSINKRKIAGDDTKEVWVGLGKQNGAVYGLEVSKSEVLAYNSRADIQMVLYNKARELGSMQAAIEQLTKLEN